MIKNNLFDLEISWQEALRKEFEKPYIVKLTEFIETERSLGQVIYPSEELIFNAFSKTPLRKVKVVIVGQDPYHGEGQAHGLSFSVPNGVRLPPSLKNIFKELASDLAIPIPLEGCLTSWAEQGVLLLNSVLTVRKGEPHSHQGKGWEEFTNAVVNVLSQNEEPIIFVLWGKSAQDKCQLLVNSKHSVLKAAHPSPYSANSGFFGCKHFSKINSLLKQFGKEEIDWQIKN